MDERGPLGRMAGPWNGGRQMIRHGPAAAPTTTTTTNDGRRGKKEEEGKEREGRKGRGGGPFSPSIRSKGGRKGRFLNLSSKVRKGLSSKVRKRKDGE